MHTVLNPLQTSAWHLKHGHHRSIQTCRKSIGHYLKASTHIKEEEKWFNRHSPDCFEESGVLEVLMPFYCLRVKSLIDVWNVY